MVDDIITAVVGVAGIEADTQAVFFCHTIIDLCEFFKGPSDLRAFSGHSFQSDQTIRIIGKHFIQSFDNGCSAGFYACSDVCAWVKYQHAASHGSSAHQLQPKKIDGQFIGFRFDGVGQIDNIRSVDDKFRNAFFLHQCLGGFDVQFA